MFSPGFLGFVSNWVFGVCPHLDWLGSSFSNSQAVAWFFIVFKWFFFKKPDGFGTARVLLGILESSRVGLFSSSVCF
jgi:hypothetical protein